MSRMNSVSNLKDILSIDVLQEIQDNFAKISGMAFITVDYKGHPITTSSGFTPFCDQCRENPSLRELCFQCDAHGGLQSTIKGEPYIYTCHAGLVDFAIPLIVNSQYYGAVLAGQIKLPEEEKDKVAPLFTTQSDWNINAKLAKLHSEVNIVSYERLQGVVTLLHDVVQHYLDTGYSEHIRNRYEQQAKELISERSIRIKLEQKIKDTQKGILLNQVKTDFLFGHLSIVSRLAFMEDAMKTEKAVNALSEILRYAFQTDGTEFSTLRAEVNHCRKYLEFQQLRLDNKVAFSIDIPDHLLDHPCPFMVLQPIVENAVIYGIEPKPTQGHIRISCRREKADLIITIENDGVPISQEVMDAIHNLEPLVIDGKGRYDLCNINRYLIGFFGNDYFLRMETFSGRDGTRVTVRIPVGAAGQK